MARSWISGTVRVVEKDRGFTELKKKLGRALNGLSISVGVQGDEAAQLDERSKTPMGDVAAINEFGGAVIPPRPFLGTAFEAANGWRAQVAQAGRDVVAGMSAEAAMQRVATKILGDVHKILDTSRGRFRPNADETIDRKGHDTPLVDDPGNRELRDAVTARVMRGKVVVR